MEIRREHNSLIISGQVSKFDDYDTVKAAVEQLRMDTDGKLTLVFNDAQTIISALIGYFIKLRRVDDINSSFAPLKHQILY
ncbi:hypothetical protein Dacet_1500 [Denitrovibrio acetiphilus DSM 12809]|uniref:STAS domain-containing protein n=1 Tax=Denitrovibrio acetiphilus (strain DSM 12809 / NBRC 114555 / N2460) TaxID=522772 RepID=D4H8C0_DENA2|nr:hypothetical protein [Denitrovibrio acetiphilus]ADD68269.1 hypothetical protein Dacet_1500 [Denitrovibrio acetiphilus DSM 12809]